MAMLKRETERQQDLFVTYEKLPRSPGHVFYDKLNGLLADGGFDAHVEAICEPFYSKGKGRPSVPPGVYFRMLLVGYFEGIGSQRGIAWRCSDSLSLRKFLGIPLGQDSPEHVVDLDSEIILAAEIYEGDQHDSRTLEDSLHAAQTNQREAGSEQQITDAVADKGYHANEQLTALREHTSYRTYIPEPALKHRRVWTGKPPEQKTAVYANRRRTRSARGRKLQRLRSEKAERTFAHVCETGGARRTWLIGIEKLRKRYLISAGAHNLSVLMRVLFNMGTPRGLQQFRTALGAVVSALQLACVAILAWGTARRRPARLASEFDALTTHAERPALAA